MLLETAPEVVLEDDDVLVVDKPAPLVCHSASRPEHPTLVGWLRERGLVTPHLVNRLDRETSGLVIVAKHERAATLLGKQVQRREIHKEYVAIVWGAFEQERGTIDQPIGMAKNSAVYTRRAVDRAAGQPCVTEFAVEQRLAGFTIVRLHPLTGRAHQLRVHLAWMGHPIVGDKMYGPDETLYLRFIQEGVTDEMLGRLLLPRHALHARRVAFRHPVTQRPCEAEAALPGDMGRFITEHS